MICESSECVSPYKSVQAVLTTTILVKRMARIMAETLDTLPFLELYQLSYYDILLLADVINIGKEVRS